VFLFFVESYSKLVYNNVQRQVLRAMYGTLYFH